MNQPRILEVRTKILKKNDELAREMRDEFRNAGVVVVNFVSSPGTGKTTFLRETLRRLVQANIPVAAVVGDLETDNDARRLAESGAPVRQIMTHGMCHLEAEMVRHHIQDWDLQSLDFLFIENVGNLVCPTSWDLGESLRVALLSVTEGEDKPLKYPGIFNTPMWPSSPNATWRRFANSIAIRQFETSKAFDLVSESWNPRPKPDREWTNGCRSDDALGIECVVE